VDIGPGLAKQRDHRAVQVATVDLQLRQGTVALDVSEQLLGGLVFSDVGREHDGAENQVHSQRPGDVALVAVEDARLALATVPHLGVTNGRHPIPSHTSAHSAASSFGIRFEILVDDPRQGLERVAQRGFRCPVAGVLGDPLTQ